MWILLAVVVFIFIIIRMMLKSRPSLYSLIWKAPRYGLHSYVHDILNGCTAASHLPFLPNLVPLQKGCIRIISDNPGRMTLQGTNMYLVGTGKTRWLIDAGSGMEKDLERLQQVMKMEKIDTLEGILLTHGHFDHVDGIHTIRTIWPSVPIWKYFPEKEDECSGHLSNALASDWNIKGFFPGQILSGCNMEIQVLYTPGHTNDHVCFYLAQQKWLFAGDCVLGNASSCVFSHLTHYMETLESLQKLNIDHVFPGHGDICKPGDIVRQRNHRQAKEDQIIQTLKKGPMTCDVLVSHLYKNLSYLLLRGATNNITHHLTKLHQEGRIRQEPSTPYYGFSSAPRYSNCCGKAVK